MSWLGKLFGVKEKAPVQVVSITDENFKTEVLESDVPVLLDIWSHGCGPCRMLEPVVMELSQDYAGRLKVAELNVESGLKTARRFNVSGTPTVLYFKKGRVVERVVGYRAKHYHQEYLDHELLGPPAEEARKAAEQP